MAQKNIDIVKRLYQEAISAGKLHLMDELIAEDFVDHEAFPGVEPGREGAKQVFTMFLSAVPDLQARVEDLISEGDKVVARLRMQGTHQGEFIGIPASGRKIDYNAIDIFRIEDGKVAEHWGVTDTLTMMQQFGAIPS